MVKYLCNQKKEVDFMAKNENRNYVTLVCSECKEENYREEKNVWYNGVYKVKTF